MRDGKLSRSSFRIFFSVATVLAVAPTLQAAPAEGAAGLIGRAAPPSTSGSSGAFVQPYFYPSFNPYGYFGFGGFYSPFVDLPRIPPAVPYLPKFWWAEPYPSADPRQAGYNPSSGYAKESVTTLILTTNPANTRIILDGIYAGRADYLGPIQLPIGEHTLRVEAAGFEPSETVLNVEEPLLQQLEVRLKPAAQAESNSR